MLFIVAIVLGLVAGLLMKGKLSNLLDIKFEKTWIIVTACAIQIFARVMGLRGFEFAAKYSLVIQGVVFLMIFIGFWFNRHYFGIWWIGAGCFMNVLVMMANGGKMPVSYDAAVRSNMGKNLLEALKSGADGRHIALDANTKLGFLGDIILLPKFLNYWIGVSSIGDMVVALGAFFIVMEAVRGIKKVVNKTI